MKKIIYLICSICSLFLFGCNENEDETTIGHGSITYDGVAYQFDQAFKSSYMSSIVGMIDNEYIYCYYHTIELWSQDNKNHFKVVIFSKDNEIFSGEYSVQSMTIKTLGQFIQADIFMNDYEDETLSNMSMKMSLQIIKKENDKYSLELKYIASENDLAVFWDGSFS
jgi:hypothetical protein